MSAWIPRALLLIGGAALVAALVSLAVGEGGPQPEDVGGVNDTQRIYGGIEQEGRVLGPDDAEIAVTVFNDLQCGACAKFHLETIDLLIEEYARTDRARFELRHFPVVENQLTLAALAAAAAGEQGRQWQYADLFFRNQDLARPEVDEELLREVAEAVPELEVERWEAAFDSQATEDAVLDDGLLAAELELPGEPAVVVTGPEGRRKLIETPSQAEIEAAIAAVS